MVKKIMVATAILAKDEEDGSKDVGRSCLPTIYLRIRLLRIYSTEPEPINTPARMRISPKI